MTEQEMVREFHSVFGATVNESPTIPSDADCKLRLELIKEEWSELSVALFSGDIVETADALADMLYVLLGTAVTCGIDLGPVFTEVHRSNMTKLWTGEEISKQQPAGTTANRVEHLAGKTERYFVVKRADGKVLKSPSYEPARIAELLNPQPTKTK